MSYPSPPDDMVRGDAADWWARMHGDPSDTDRVAFEQWLVASPTHRAAYDRLTREWDQAKFLAGTSVGRDRDLSRARPRTWPRRALAASLAALVVLGGTGYGLHYYWVGRTAIPIVQATYHSGTGQIRSLQFADGSTVILDTDSRLQVAYTHSARNLTLLTGRARFIVAHERQRPFVVHAAGRLIIAHGTIFDVTLTSPSARVSLWRGAIEVRDAVAPRGQPVVARNLHPGQQLSLATALPRDIPQPAPPDDRQWVSGMISFDAMPLGNAIAAINSYNTSKLELADPGLASLRITGAFPARDPSGFAAAVAADFGLHIVDRADGSLLLTRQPA